MSVKTYAKGVKTKLSENFNVSEFACHGSGCCSTVLIDEQLVTYLQKIRSHFGKPITITSGYRCAKHNKSVGGATASRHAQGMAADIVVQGIAPAEVAKYAESIGIKGIGLYETAKDGYFVHVDTRTSKSFWYGQAQAYRSTFGGATNNTTTSKKEDSAASGGTTASKKATESARSFLVSLAGTYKVTASALNVRNGAGITKKILVTIPKGTAVKCYGYYTSVLGTKWLYVQFAYKGVSYCGFASSQYLAK